MTFDPSKTENNFTLETEELAFAKLCSTPRNQLILAVMLKFFQINGRYPNKKDVIDPLFITMIAVQLDVPVIPYDELTDENRTTVRLRRKIRDFLGLNIPTPEDTEKFIQWLMEYTINEPHTFPHYLLVLENRIGFA